MATRALQPAPRMGGPICRRRDSPSGARPNAGACTRPRWSCWPTRASTCATSRRSRCSAPPAPRWTAAACASRRAWSRTRWRARRASGCSSRAAVTPQPLVAARRRGLLRHRLRRALRARPRERRAPPGPPRRRRGHGRALRGAAQHRLHHDRWACPRTPRRGSTTWSRSSPCCGARASRCSWRRATAACSRACRRWRRPAARRRASASTPCRRRRSCTTPTRSPRSSAARSCSSRSSTRRLRTWGRRARAASPAPCSSATPRR